MCQLLGTGIGVTGVNRWQTLSGNKAKLDGNGRTFEEIAAERRSPTTIKPTLYRKRSSISLGSKPVSDRSNSASLSSCNSSASNSSSKAAHVTLRFTLPQQNLWGDSGSGSRPKL